MSGRTVYTYVGNDPLNKSDPTGQAFLVDDALGFLAGGLIGVAVQGWEDIFAGEGTYGDAAGAFVAGGIVGVGAVNAPETGGASFAAAVGGGAGFAGNLTKQAVDIGNGSQKTFSGKELAVSTAAGAVLGGAAEKLLPNVKISGLSSGQGNMKAVAQGVKTKIENGTTANMSVKTAAKDAVGSQAQGVIKTTGSGAGDAAKNKACSTSPLDTVCH